MGWRKTRKKSWFQRISKKIDDLEIVGDMLFLLISFIIAVIAIFIFDIHWNFYEGGQLFPPAKHIFTDPMVYVWGGLLGAITGYVLIKTFIYAMKKERIWKTKKK